MVEVEKCRGSRGEDRLRTEVRDFKHSGASQKLKEKFMATM